LKCLLLRQTKVGIENFRIFEIAKYAKDLCSTGDERWVLGLPARTTKWDRNGKKSEIAP